MSQHVDLQFPEFVNEMVTKSSRINGIPDCITDFRYPEALKIVDLS